MTLHEREETVQDLTCYIMEDTWIGLQSHKNATITTMSLCSLTKLSYTSD